MTLLQSPNVSRHDLTAGAFAIRRRGEPIETLSADVVGQQVDAMRQEIDSLRGEIELLRKRDNTVNFYMQRLDEELRMAARLQQDFLPKSLPAVGPVRFHALWRPAGYVSGDLYDVVRLDEEHLGFYIADAVGHGVPAALLTMFIKHALVTKEVGNQRYRVLDPGESLSRLNQSLIAQNLATGTFCTACYGVLNVQTLTLQLASAGHPAPLLLRDDDPPAVLKTEGPLLGIFEDETYRTMTHQLRPGDRVVLHTDGVEVAFGSDAHGPTVHAFQEELFKRRRLAGEPLINDLVRRLDDESGSLDPRDDLTILVAEIR